MMNYVLVVCSINVALQFVLLLLVKKYYEKIGEDTSIRSGIIVLLESVRLFSLSLVLVLVVCIRSGESPRMLLEEIKDSLNAVKVAISIVLFILCMAMITIGEKHTKVRLKCYGGLIYICTIIMTIWIVEDIYGTA